MSNTESVRDILRSERRAVGPVRWLVIFIASCLWAVTPSSNGEIDWFLIAWSILTFGTAMFAWIFAPNVHRESAEETAVLAEALDDALDGLRETLAYAPDWAVTKWNLGAHVTNAEQALTAYRANHPEEA